MKRVIVVALVLLTGCATDTPSITTAEPSTTAISAAASVAETTDGSGGGSASIAASDFAFSPSNLTVKVGESVIWNLTEGAHTATSGTAPEGDGLFNETLAADAPFSFTFEEPGEYRFFCRFHPDFMTGTVTVEP